MRFEGEKLIDILRKQTQSILICDASGVPFGWHPSIKICAEETGFPPEHFRLPPGRFFGIGNKNRIRYIQAADPATLGIGWRGGNHTTRPVRADGTGKRGAGQLLGNSRAIREHIPCPGNARRPKFAYCPPIQVKESETHSIGDSLQLGRNPDGPPTCTQTAPIDLFPRKPRVGPIDTRA